MRRLILNVQAPALLAIVAAAALSGAASAQEKILDKGVFTLFLGDREIGTETFTVQSVGAEPEAKIMASGVVEMDTGTGLVEARPILQTNADRSPLAYQNVVTGRDNSEVTINARDRRFVAVIQSAAGERERELRAPQGAVFLEGTVVHQYYFLPTPSGGTMEVPVIVPQTGQQVQARLTATGSESIRIGGESVDARKVRLEVEGQAREIWFDEDGRVLRLSIPAENFRAERQEL